MSFPMNGNGRKIAIVSAARTPFARAWTLYKDVTSAELGAEAVRGLLHHADLDPKEVDYLSFGCAAAPINGPHVGREVVFLSPLPSDVPASTVQFYCASSARSVIDGANEIALGHADVVVAGGVDSMSEHQVLFSKNFTHTMQVASKAKSVGARLGALKSLSFGDLAPEAPGINEPTTGKSMGRHAELMAKEMGIPRAEQDAWAVESHHRAHRAYENGHLAEQVKTVHMPPKFDPPLDRDTDVRPDTSVEQLARLRPVFDKAYGSVTAGNASPLTDGASAILMMSEERAKALGYEPMCYIRSYAMAGIDIQKEHLLLGPTYSAPVALERAGMKLSDIDFVEMHEAFASQVLATVRRFESKEHAKNLGLKAPIGNVDMDAMNPNGGSIAMGHPFGATGTRVIGQAALEMRRADRNTCFVSICAGGGLGFSMVLERN